MKFAIAFVILIAIGAGVAFWYFSPQLFNKTENTSNQPVTLELWGLWEDESLIKPIIDEYQGLHPNVTIHYSKNNQQNYRPRVQAQIDDNKGPDIYIIHNSWLPMFLTNSYMAPAPAEVISVNEFRQTYYPVARDSFIKDQKIYALPRGIDGLALYYNEDILKAANVPVPQTWDQFREAAYKTTVVDQQGTIKTAGAAMGVTNNVANWSDIIGLFFSQQADANIAKPGSPSKANPNSYPGVEILRFYTSFASDPQKKTWDSSMEPSTQAFAAGRLAFYFAPSWRAYELRAANPQLNFKTAPVPQLSGGSTAWASFWGYTVSGKSQNQLEAWKFLKFLTSADSEKTLYKTASEVRLFGLPYSRTDLQKELINDPLVGAFVSQGPNYKSWYLTSDTYDAGLDTDIIKYYEDAVNATATGGDPKSALETADKGIEQVLARYNIPLAPNPTPGSLGDI